MSSEPAGAGRDTAPLMKILIVDDTPSAVRLLIDTLSSEPYELLTAASGTECLEVAARECPDVVLLDVMLPGMSGFETCQHLRQTTGVADIVVLMITALDDRRARLSAFAAGADDFLAKPFDRVELRLRLRGIARLNRFRKLAAMQAREADANARRAADALGVLQNARLLLGHPDPEHASPRHLAVAEDAIDRATTLLQPPSHGDAAALHQGLA